MSRGREARAKGHLSKSHYISGLQCAKQLWFKVNAPGEIPPFSESTQARLDRGHEVGRLAQRLFPGGVEIARGRRSWKTMVEATARAVLARIPVYEASFVHAGAGCRVDILAPVEGGQWDLYEVKSTASAKEVHHEDIAFQSWVVRGAGVPLRRSHLVHLDSSYVRRGPIELARLFAIVDLTAELEPLLPLVAGEVERQQGIAALAAAPEVPIGPHCDTPYECPLMSVCWADVHEPSVLDLSRGGPKAWDLFRQGIRELAAIPPHVPLTRLQRIQLAAVRSGEAQVDREALEGFLARLEHPLHYFDLESFQLDVPPFDGVRPFEQIPFQYSLHVVEKPGATPRAVAFLAEGDGDPRPAFLVSLRAAIGSEGSVVVYNADFERRRLAEAAIAFPEHRAWIDALLSRFVDLIEPFERFDYHHPAQNGSASLKWVLPVLGNAGYDHLEVQEGTAAARAFLRLRAGELAGGEAERLRAALLAYCGRDTEGMVEIVAALERLVNP